MSVYWVFFRDHAQFADAIYQLNYKLTLKTLMKKIHRRKSDND